MMGAGDEGDGVEDSGHQRGTCLCLRSHSVGQAEAGSLGSLRTYIPGLGGFPGPLSAPSVLCPPTRSGGRLDGFCGETAGTAVSCEQGYGKRRKRRNPCRPLQLSPSLPLVGGTPPPCPAPQFRISFRGCGRRGGIGPRALPCPLFSRRRLELLLLLSQCFWHRG